MAETSSENKKESPNGAKEIHEGDKNELRSGWKVTLNFDLIQLILFIFAAALRMIELEKPRAIVFDEILFGKYSIFYLHNKFYYDLFPPLGKMMIAASAKFAGYSGNFTFDKIGQEYPEDVPVLAMRFLPALCGSLLVPTVYQILLEMKFHFSTACLAAVLVMLDNSLHTQSRFMVMEGFLCFFSALSIIGFLNFRKQYQRSFSMQWWTWLCFTGVMSGLTGCVKYGGVFTGFLIIGLVLYDFWMLIIPDISVPDNQLYKHLWTRLAVLVGIPLCIYSLVFYAHLSMLTKSGAFDGQMSSHFQASLEGGLAAITKGQPLKVSHGSQITMRRTKGARCWLHSHNHTYPVTYPDLRNSSQEQQVTCYSFKDVHNWWIIKRPDADSLAVEDPPRPIRDGDVIHIVHGKTLRLLNSHNVAAPMTPLHQEVSCFINYTKGVPPNTLWRVKILNKDAEGPIWKIITSQVQLIHVNSSTVLKTSGGLLPEWGFNQLEVVTDTLHGQESAVWNVEEHRYTKSAESHGKEVKISQAALIPTEPIFMSMFNKFKELQIKMLFTSLDANLEHRYSSTPLEWPLCDKTIAYWLHPKHHGQIHLLGNLVSWYTGVVFIVMYFILLVLYLLADRRQLMPFHISTETQRKYVIVGQVLILGYAVNYLPYFLTSRTLFLHHYLPAVPFKLMAIAAMCEIFYGMLRSGWMRAVFQSIVIAWLSAVYFMFSTLRTLNQGTMPLQKAELENYAWKESWDFIYH